MISALIMLFGLALASGGALLVVYAKDGAQESLGGVVALVAFIILAVGFLGRVYGI